MPTVRSSDNEAGDTRAMPRRVLVATDTRATSAGAEHAGVQLAARAGASLIFLSVIDPSRLRLPGGLFHTRVDQVRAQRESALSRVVENARKHGVSAQYLIWEGDPGASVIEAAAAEGADVIVVGSHDRGSVGRLLLGSVSAHVVEHGAGQVVVIRPGQELDDVWPIAVTRRRERDVNEKAQRLIRRPRARRTSAAATPETSRNAGLG